MRTAIVGVGAMGRRHIEVVKDLELDLVGICDLRQESLDDVSGEYGLSAEMAYSNLAQMLDKANPECVIIATTAPSHAALTIQVAEAGARYILCEKPMASSLEECDRMIETCDKLNVGLAINHPQQFIGRFQQIKCLTRSEAFGQLTSVTVVAGNFGLAMNASHLIEMFRFLTDEFPIEVSAGLTENTAPNPRGAEFDDHGGFVLMTTESGKRLYIDASVDQGHGVMATFAGTYGQLQINLLTGVAEMMTRRRDDRGLSLTRYGMPSEITELANMPADVHEAARAALEGLLGGNDYPGGNRGRAVIAALVAAHVSSESGHRPIRIDDSLPAERKFLWP